MNRDDYSKPVGDKPDASAELVALSTLLGPMNRCGGKAGCGHFPTKISDGPLSWGLQYCDACARLNEGSDYVEKLLELPMAKEVRRFYKLLRGE